LLASKRKDNNDKLIDALPAVIVITLVLVWFQTGNLSLVIALYLIILSAIFGTGFYLYRRYRKRIFESGIEQIDNMSGVMFERLLLEYFRVVGYKANLTAEKADYGADLVLKKDSIKYVVQAKRWKDKDVGIEAVQQVVGAIRYYGADKGMVVTNSHYTKNAKKLAESNNIELWDRRKLIALLNQVKGSELIEGLRPDGIESETKLICPRCGEKLVLRNGKNGVFYGCKRFPKCWHTQDANV